LKPYRGKRVIYALILNIDNRGRLVVNFTARPIYPAKERLVMHVIAELIIQKVM
jgi:hypothetical protein